jgi:hypothetical protein
MWSGHRPRHTAQNGSVDALTDRAVVFTFCHTPQPSLPLVSNDDQTPTLFHVPVWGGLFTEFPTVEDLLAATNLSDSSNVLLSLTDKMLVTNVVFWR